jgi:RNA polymerase sigma-70 factor (ECF subfamily)
VNEKKIVEKAVKGDKESFGLLVESYQARLRAYTARYVLSREDVFELVQQAFINAFHHIGDFDPEKEFGPWIRTICLNCIRNYLRNKASRQQALDSYVHEAIAARIGTEEVKAFNSEKLSALQECVKILKNISKKIIFLRYQEETAVKDIASRLGRSESSVSVALYSIKKTLKKCIQKKLDNGYGYELS